MSRSLAELLNHHLANLDWSFEKLAEAARLPRNTVYRWTRGEVKRVRHWQDLAKTAHALMLNRSQANELLIASGHPAIDALLERTTDEDDRALLSRWTSTSPNNLPAQLTSFIGREVEREQVIRLLSSARLVTLTGPGGAGKTRLALEATQSIQDEFDEVAFIDLAPVRDPDLVIPTISRTLGLKESLDDPSLHTLATHLSDRKTLLVLDNLEQVIEAAPLVSELLGATRHVKALVTSRTRLNVRGEREFEVPPLALPTLTSGFEEIVRNPAVTLFVHRAQTANPSFTLTPENAPLVAEICQRLDGLPLGIELAAARTRHVPLGAMLDRFPGSLWVASGGPRDLPARQQTLRAAIAWSYDLLAPGEQRLFTCAGMFAGGFTQDAIESVCAALQPLGIEVSEGLESLVEQNLLRQVWDTGDEPRFRMMETLREYAQEKLDESGEAKAAQDAAARYYLELAERADLEGETQEYWLRRLTADHANFQAALAWCKENGRAERGWALSIALMPLWHLRDHPLEARTWLDAFLAAENKVTPSLRARGLLWRGLLLMRGTGGDSPASLLFGDALALFREIGDLDGTSETLQALGDVYRNQGEMTLASQRYAASLELAMQAGNAYLAAHGYMGLALCALDDGRFGAARRYWEQMLDWAEASGNKASRALALNGLGEMARHEKDWDAAERSYGQTLSLARELGHESRIAMALHNLGYVAMYRGQPDKAGRLFAEALLLYKGRQFHKGIAECLAGLAMVECARGNLEAAATLCGAAETMLQGLGTRLDTLDRADFERTLATVKDGLGDRFRPLLAEGRAMSMECAIETAIALTAVTA